MFLDLTSIITRASSQSSRNKSGKQRITVITISSVVAMGTFLMLFCRRKRTKLNEELTRYNSEMASLGNLTENERQHELPQYSMKAVQVATDNFSEANKLGKGGFGSVYKGELNGRLVAVKRLSQQSGQGVKEFMYEVISIAKLRHKNLVRLLGCCVERGEKMPVYEFMPNSSLDKFLNGAHHRQAYSFSAAILLKLCNNRNCILIKTST